MLKNVEIQSASSLRFGASRFVIGLPLLVSLLFAFSYLQIQSQSQQRSITAAHAKSPSAISEQPALPLITQPAIPTLSQMDDDTITTIAPVESGVGPSPTDAGTALQSTAQDKSNNGNSRLQATRKALKLDSLSL